MIRLTMKRFGAIAAASVRPGMILRLESGGYVEVTSYQHGKSSQGSVSSTISYLDLKSLKLGRFTVNTEHRLISVTLDPVSVLVQFISGNYLVVSHAHTFEELNIPLSLVTGAESLLQPGTKITVYFDDEGEAVRVGLSLELREKLRNSQLN